MATDNPYIVNLTGDQQQAIGEYVTTRYNDSKVAKKMLELDWIEAEAALRREFFDPKHEKALEEDDKSTLFPGLIRRKVTSYEARMIELLFPRTDRNWTLEPKKVPELSETDILSIVADLQQQQIPLSKEAIDAAALKLAQQNADELVDVIDDHLDTIGGGSDKSYEVLGGTVFRHGSRYRVGVAKGPMTIAYNKTDYSIETDPLTGQQKVVLEDKQAYRPYAEVVNPQDWFPDFSAKNWEDCEFHIHRHRLTYANYAEWAKRTGWTADRGVKWLRDNPKGKVSETDFDTRERSIDITNGGVNQKLRNRYEVLELWGSIRRDDLDKWKIKPPTDLGDAETFLMGLWVVDGRCAMAMFHPIQDIRLFHCFVYDGTTSSMIGDSFVSLLYSAQNGYGAATRALSDNAAFTGGPMFEVDVELARQGTDVRPGPFKVIHKEGGTNNQRAVMPVEIPDKTAQLAAVANYFKQMGDEDTFSSSQPGADVSVGASEAMRTRLGVVALMSTTALPFKDAVVNFDRFTASFIDAMVKWEHKFGPLQSKADVVPVAQGARSLLGREVAAAEMSGFMQTLPQWMQPAFDIHKLGQAWAESQNFNAKKFVKPEEQFIQEQQAQQQAQDQMQQLQMQLIQMQIEKEQSDAFKGFTQGTKNLAGANSVAVKAVTELMKLGFDEDAIGRALEALGGQLNQPGGAGAAQPAAPTGPSGAGQMGQGPAQQVPPQPGNGG
jgi:hypothetical protein